ncbi:hypothetical protein CUJ87_23955 [Paraburkholderia caledonica]|nr:hypothetical protein CUJ87_23955 [Paraburkholderia caledonica]
MTVVGKTSCFKPRGRCGADAARKKNDRQFETARFQRMQRDVWSYRYLENNINHMIFHFYFDDAGILRQTQKAPDPMYDNTRRGRF